MGGEKVVYSSVDQAEKLEDELFKKKAPKGFGARHMQVLLTFTSLSVAYSMRSQLSVSMVAMTSKSPVESCNIILNGTAVDNDANGTYFNNVTGCSNHSETELSKWNVYRTYNWNKPTQEMILFAFFMGYTIMMIPMGIIAQKYGGKKPVLVALAVNGVISILSPWVPIFAGWVGMCACRLLQGMTQAAFYPSIHTILGKWAPLGERGRLTTYVYTGAQFGTVMIFQMAGLFAGSPSLGWPAIFWLCGILSLLCFGLYYWLGSAAPQEHPTITTEELMHIMGDGSADVKKRQTPWKSILTSTAVWGLVTAHAGSMVGHIMMLTQTPTYMSKVLGVDIKRNGLYSSLPYIAMYLLTIGFGHIADLIYKKNLMTIANIRRFFNSLGMIISSIFMIALGYISNTSTSVIILILTIGLHSGVHVGFHINQIDLSPNFAGPIMALGNMIANLVCLLVPVMVSNIIGNDVTNQHRWQILFIVVALFQVITNIIFVIFVKGKVQPWNFYGDEEHEFDAAMNVVEEKAKSVVEEMNGLNEKQVKT